MSKKLNPPCPKCSTLKVIPIEYGYPNYEMYEESQKGKFVLGGCCVSDNNPNWHCTECENEW